MGARPWHPKLILQALGALPQGITRKQSVEFIASILVASAQAIDEDFDEEYVGAMSAC